MPVAKKQNIYASILEQNNKEDTLMRVKKIIAATLIGITMISSTYSTDAATLFYAKTGRENLKVYVTATTTKNKLTNTSSYGLIKGKYVKKVTIRLKEGSYNKSKSTGDGTIKISKKNDPRYTAKGTWTWTYK